MTWDYECWYWAWEQNHERIQPNPSLRLTPPDSFTPGVRKTILCREKTANCSQIEKGIAIYNFFHKKYYAEKPLYHQKDVPRSNYELHPQRPHCFGALRLNSSQLLYRWGLGDSARDRPFPRALYMQFLSCSTSSNAADIFQPFFSRVYFYSPETYYVLGDSSCNRLTFHPKQIIIWEKICGGVRKCGHLIIPI